MTNFSLSFKEAAHSFVFHDAHTHRHFTLPHNSLLTELAGNRTPQTFYAQGPHGLQIKAAHEADGRQSTKFYNPEKKWMARILSRSLAAPLADTDSEINVQRLNFDLFDFDKKKQVHFSGVLIDDPKLHGIHAVIDEPLTRHAIPLEGADFIYESGPSKLHPFEIEHRLKLMQGDFAANIDQCVKELNGAQKNLAAAATAPIRPTESQLAGLVRQARLIRA